jgi:hypothetical protein
LETSGKPKRWDELKTLVGAVEMDQITFLSTGWERVSGENGEQEEERIREALRKDVEQGLAFEALWDLDGNEARGVIEDVIASSSQEARNKRKQERDELNRRTEKEKWQHDVEGRKRRHEEIERWEEERKRRHEEIERWEEERKRRQEERQRQEEERKRREEEENKRREEEERKRREEDERRRAGHKRRVNNLQHEIDNLYTELDKTEDGRELRIKLVRADKELRKYLLPIATQLDNPNIESAKRKELQRKMEEYTLSWREFRGHFAEVRAMHIDIGPNLRSFYGLPPPVSRPCSN